MADVTVSESQDDGRSRTRNRIVGGAVAIVIVLAIVGLAGPGRWWGVAASPPFVNGIGFSSDDMEGVRISTPLESGTIFRCTPGTLEMFVGFIASDASIELLDVSVPWLDETWADLGWVERTGTQVMRDPNGAGDADDLVDFTGRHLSPDAGWARMKLTWQFDECTEMDGIMWIDQVEVTYRAAGRTRHAQVSLLQPLRLTTQSIDNLTEQVTVEPVGAAQSGGSST